MDRSSKYARMSALAALVAAGTLLWSQPLEAGDNLCRFIGIGHSVGYHAYDCCPGYCQPKFGAGAHFLAGHGPGCCPTGGCPACQGGYSAGYGSGQMYYDEARRRAMSSQPALASRPQSKSLAVRKPTPRMAPSTGRALASRSHSFGYGSPPRAALAAAPVVRRQVQQVAAEDVDASRATARFDSNRLRQEPSGPALGDTADTVVAPANDEKPVAQRRHFNAVVTAVPASN